MLLLFVAVVAVVVVVVVVVVVDDHDQWWWQEWQRCWCYCENHRKPKGISGKTSYIFVQTYRCSISSLDLIEDFTAWHSEGETASGSLLAGCKAWDDNRDHLKSSTSEHPGGECWVEIRNAEYWNNLESLHEIPIAFAWRGHRTPNVFRPGMGQRIHGVFNQGVDLRVYP